MTGVNGVNSSKENHYGRNVALGTATGATIGGVAGYALTNGATVKDGVTSVKPDVFVRAVKSAIKEEAKGVEGLSEFQKNAADMVDDSLYVLNVNAKKGPTSAHDIRAMIRNMDDNDALLKEVEGEINPIAYVRNTLKTNPSAQVPESDLRAAVNAINESTQKSKVEFLKSLTGNVAELPEVAAATADGASAEQITAALKAVEKYSAPNSKFANVLLASNKDLSDAISNVSDVVTDEQKTAVMEAYQKAVKADSSVEIKGLSENADEAFEQIKTAFKAGKENIDGGANAKGVKAAVEEAFVSGKAVLRKTSDELEGLGKEMFAHVKKAVKTTKMKGALVVGAAAAVVGAVTAFVITKVNAKK